MRVLHILLAACCLAVGCGFTDLERQADRERSQELLRDADWGKTKAIFQRLALCTVTVRPAGSDGFLPTARGTGVLISRDGTILTCAHVVELMCDSLAPGEELDVVFFNGRAVKASLVAFDRKFDLALLRTGIEGLPVFAQPAAGVKTMPGDLLVALVREGENEPIERLITAGKVIVPYSALVVPGLENPYTSGLLLRTYGYAGMSGAPLFTRDGRLAGIIRRGVIRAFDDGSSFLIATPTADILRLLPDLKGGRSDGSSFSPREFLAERERQNALQMRLAQETNPEFEKDQRFSTAVGVVTEQYAAAIDGMRRAGNADRFAEEISLVCILDLYAARYMYPTELCADLEAFFESAE